MHYSLGRAIEKVIDFDNLHVTNPFDFFTLVFSFKISVVGMVLIFEFSMRTSILYEFA